MPVPSPFQSLTIEASNNSSFARLFIAAPIVVIVDSSPGRYLTALMPPFVYVSLGRKDASDFPKPFMYSLAIRGICVGQ